MPHRTAPVRPDAGLTEDGRPMQLVTSYARRGSRLSPKQQQAWDRHVEDWLLPGETVVAEGFDQQRWFGRTAPLIVEIGSGSGESLAALAGVRPAYDVLGIEVWRPGVASTFANLEAAGVDNVRMLSLDAVWAIEALLRPASLAELWTFFPDPWHKKRHHKRRLVDAEFATLAASRLTSGGCWRLSTDWEDYADQMVEVLGAEPLLQGGVVERWAERPVTKFERRGIAAGRRITDVRFERRAR